MPSDSSVKFDMTPPAKMIRKIRCMPQQQLKDIVQLHHGVPDFGPPAQLIDAGHRALDTEDLHQYPPIQGSARLRAMICAKYMREQGVTITPSQVMVASGAKQCLFQFMLAMIKPKDEVLLVGPMWTSFTQQVLTVGAMPIFLSADHHQDFKVTPEQLESAITENTKLVLMSFPNNPSGAVLTPEEVQAYAAVIKRHPDVYLVSDEMYEYFIYEDKITSFITCESIRRQLIVLNGFSKSYGVSGWRIGFAIGPEPVINNCVRMQSLISGGVCAVMQQAACAALDLGIDHIEKAMVGYQRRYQMLKELLSDVPDITVCDSKGGFFALVDVNAYLAGNAPQATLVSADEVAMYMLDEHKVAVIGSDGFGIPGYLRVSLCASDEDIEEGCRRMKKALMGLRTSPVQYVVKKAG